MIENAESEYEELNRKREVIILSLIITIIVAILGYFK